VFISFGICIVDVGKAEREDGRNVYSLCNGLQASQLLRVVCIQILSFLFMLEMNFTPG
jgi:hypothetical protein